MIEKKKKSVASESKILLSFTMQLYLVVSNIGLEFMGVGLSGCVGSHLSTCFHVVEVEDKYLYLVLTTPIINQLRIGVVEKLYFFPLFSLCIDYMCYLV